MSATKTDYAIITTPPGPMPRKGGGKRGSRGAAGLKYPFAKLDIGEAFFLPVERPISGTMRRAASITGHIYTSYKGVADGIEGVEDGTPGYYIKRVG